MNKVENRSYMDAKLGLENHFVRSHFAFEENGIVYENWFNGSKIINFWSFSRIQVYFVSLQILNMLNKNKQVLPCLINLSSIYLYNIFFVIENTNQHKHNKIFSFELLSLCEHYWTLYGTLFGRGAFPIFWISHHHSLTCSPPDCLKQHRCIGEHTRQAKEEITKFKDIK